MSLLDILDQEYQMVKFGGYRRDEFYDMTPLERDLLMGIHNQYKEKESQQIDNIKKNMTVPKSL